MWVKDNQCICEFPVNTAAAVWHSNDASNRSSTVTRCRVRRASYSGRKETNKPSKPSILQAIKYCISHQISCSELLGVINTGKRLHVHQNKQS